MVSANDPPLAVFSPSPPAPSALPAVPYDIVNSDNEGFYVRDLAGKNDFTI